LYGVAVLVFSRAGENAFLCGPVVLFALERVTLERDERAVNDRPRMRDRRAAEKILTAKNAKKDKGCPALPDKTVCQHLIL
jgi:hypothetical protein